jgi:hypothetical protein
MKPLNSSSDSASPRPTLTLKVGARKPARPSKTSAMLAPPKTGKSKPGASWSEEHKERMQADMDALRWAARR